MASVPDGWRGDGDLTAWVEAELDRYEGRDREKAAAAALEFNRNKGFVGTWDKLTARYREEMEEAVAS